MTNGTKYRKDTSTWTLKEGQKILIPEHNRNELHKSFYQSPVSKNSCSIHGIMTAIANSFDVDFPLEERKAIWERALDLGASNDWGWRFADAINLLKNRCKETDKQKFRYYEIKNTEFETYAKLGFMIYGGIRIKEGSTRDMVKDGVIGDDVDTYGDNKFGHGVCFGMIGDKFGMINNYPGHTKYNEATFVNLKKLLKKGYFFETGYILMTDNVDEIEDGLSRRKEVQDKEIIIAENSYK